MKAVIAYPLMGLPEILLGKPILETQQRQVNSTKWPIVVLSFNCKSHYSRVLKKAIT